MPRSKADFKARREMLGISQQLMADMLHIDVRNVKRLEKPGYEMAPGLLADAWEIIDTFMSRQTQEVDFMLDKVVEVEDLTGDSPREVLLTYWTGPEPYEAAHPDEGKKLGLDDGALWQVANATARRVACTLEDENYTVVFSFDGITDQ